MDYEDINILETLKTMPLQDLSEFIAPLKVKGSLLAVVERLIAELLKDKDAIGGIGLDIIILKAKIDEIEERLHKLDVRVSELSSICTHRFKRRVERCQEEHQKVVSELVDIKRDVDAFDKICNGRYASRNTHSAD